MTSAAIYTPFLPEQYCVYHTTYSGTLLPPNYIGSSSVDNVLNKDYHGSVASKRYKSIWLSELKLHPELFSTVIISYHDTRSNATHKEYHLQMIFNVVKSDLFINRAYASVNGWCDTIYTDEEKEATAKKMSDAWVNRTAEKKEVAEQKRLDTIANKSNEEKVVTSKKRSDALVIAHAKKTAEEKAATAQKRSCTISNKTIEEKSVSRKIRSDAQLNRNAEELTASSKKQSDTKANKTTEEKAATTKKRSAARKGVYQPIEQCPHCMISGGRSLMKRYHFDKCKLFNSARHHAIILLLCH